MFTDAEQRILHMKQNHTSCSLKRQISVQSTFYKYPSLRQQRMYTRVERHLQREGTESLIALCPLTQPGAGGSIYRPRTTFINCSPSPMVYPCDTNTTRLNVSAMINSGRLSLCFSSIPSTICCCMLWSVSMP